MPLRMMSKTKRGVLDASMYFPDRNYLTRRESAVQDVSRSCQTRSREDDEAPLSQHQNAFELVG